MKKQDWIDLTQIETHDMTHEELLQFSNELKNAVSELLEECEKLHSYSNHVDYENTLLKASIKNQEKR